MKNKNAGFSLVELAISITVIGLILALVAKGGEMIENAKIASTVLQIESYQAGIDGFRTTYKAWPGDYDRAEMYIEDCTAANGCENGDGNGAIGTAGSFSLSVGSPLTSRDETVEAWRHLFLSGYGTGLPSGVDPEFGSALPSASAGGGFEIYYNSSLNMHATTYNGGHFLRYAGVISSSNLTMGDGVYGVVARGIDHKMDDGSPTSGRVYASGSGARCVEQTVVGGVTTFSGYWESDLENENCWMHIRLE